MEQTATVPPVYTGTFAQQTTPLTTKVTSTDRQPTPIPPKPESFAPSPRYTPSLRSLACQRSYGTELRAPTNLQAYSGLREASIDHAIKHVPSRDREMFAQTQDLTSFPRTCRIASSQSWEGMFVQPSPSRWQQAHDYRRKVYEPPHLDPSTDDSIAYVEANAEFWVHQLISSIINTRDVKDTANSHHRRLFSSEGVDPLLIEACSREIFTALVDRCKNGFRGPPAFNKALQASHQLEPDRTATCEERLQNVIRVLAWNKRACKDVLYEDWKIRLLVNHPLSYDKEKDAQKGSNDQRRRRQLAEREKMERTEAELKAYREAHGEAVTTGRSVMQ